MAKPRAAQQQPEPGLAEPAPDPPMPSPDNHHWKAGPLDVPLPAGGEPELVPDHQPRAAPAPGSVWPGPSPSAEHNRWRTSDGGPPVPDPGYVPPEPVRSVSN